MAHHVHNCAEVLSLAERGLTPAEIAAELDLPRATVDIVLRHSASVTIPRPRAGDELLPWAISPEHEGDEAARLIRLEQRRRRGESLTRRDLDDLGTWLSDLQDMDGVVDYSPARGFTYVRRTDADTDFIRVPASA